MSIPDFRSVRGVAYQAALKAMFQLDPETIHTWMNKALAGVSASTVAQRGLGRVLPVTDPVLQQRVFGVDFPAPLGLAAGFDKSAGAADAWAPLGFGFAELGTVTAQPQPGNPKPRLFRLPADHAVLNRMGFNNPGAAAVASTLQRRRGDGVIGINIGKTKKVPLDGAVADYRASARTLSGVADYMVVNVSSPNTPGLRDLQAVESLRPILAAVQEESDIPVLVKIAPDLNDSDVDAVADLAVELGLAGIVATNTTISRQGLTTAADQVAQMGAGGISGRPVAERAEEVLRRLYGRVGNQLVLIGVGGIETPRQAWARINAGATLLQGYTGLIYGGPDWIRDIHLGLAAQVRAHGLNSISAAVGAGLAWRD
ncbi:quinone-dependent dihydroorotate dehydrogenase [Corynebacterium sp. TAE3-ERU12]|uniref:quinone-dependent dihydroorotate dehydrogenase n=1 Tax=Corynebacterium sp. TAE3-ERU12 TaxID=2849491 RepID=UPI001C48F65F|nr:quinone-dependent dihydroorotate dehydrogenase [Corynebacterium sp. TAE3-ERU12]MBV7295454.1 quinone-dependent dihydroorotate dehydrogenase [Corynebacterium sp. TAE3-ERU12]